MLDALKKMIASRKWIGVILMIAIGVLTQYGVLSPDLGKMVELALGLGVASQAVEDHGKAAAQIHADAQLAPTPKIMPASSAAPLPLPAPPPTGPVGV